MKKILVSILCMFLFIGLAFADEENSFDSGEMNKAINQSKSCANGDENNFCSPKFEIKVNEFTPVEHTFVGFDQTLSDFFTYVINDLMVGLGVIALLIMTVGAGYMIFYHGQDEYLSKGKSIFMAGITALIVALSSYYLVSLLRYILYS